MTDIVAAPRVALDLIYVHPSNPRIDAVADDAMVESIRHLDLLQPLTVAPNPDGEGWNLIDGHRRLDGAAKAGLTDVPVHLRADLVTEAQQIEAMAVTGLQHENLSPVEEAAAYEQLALLGMDEAAIAAATGFPVRRVKGRLQLNSLSAEAKGRLHGGEATLLDVEALLEFADDPDAAADLEAQLGSDNFAYTVRRHRERRDRAARHAELLHEFDELGATHFELEPGAYWSRNTAYPLAWFPTDDELRDPAAHDGCLGYHYDGPGSYGEPMLVCTNAAQHPAAARGEDAERRAQEQSDWERRRAEREAEQEKQRAAHATRLAWLAEHFTGMFPTKSHQPLAAAAQAFLPALIVDDREAVDSWTVLTALGVTVEPGSYGAHLEAAAAYAAEIPSQKPTAVLASFGQYLAALVADKFETEPAYLDDVDDALRQLALWDWLKAAGYPLSDPDRELRTRVEVRLTELTDGVDDTEAAS